MTFEGTREIFVRNNNNSDNDHNYLKFVRYTMQYVHYMMLTWTE